MPETPSDPKLLEEALRNALKSFFPALPATRANDPREEFYDTLLTELQEDDEYFLKRCGGELDNTLLFTTLFSAISASFILAIQTQLQPDYSKLNYAVLMFIANSTFQKTPNLGVSPETSIWTGPDSTIVHVQAVLFSSLAISLLAALIATLGKQWLSRYSESRGSFTERGRDRYRKMKGMATWRFNLFMEGLPLLLQAALLLFGYALAIYLTTINKIIAAVAIGFTSFGLLFYFLIVSTATLSYDCPFQTPLSLYIRSLLRLKDKDKNYLGQAWSWLKRMFLGGLRRSGRPNAPEEDRRDHVELTMVDLFGQPPRLAAGWTSWGDYVLDTECIAWFSRRPRSEKILMAIAGLIPEIIWHDSMGASPLKQLYDVMLECFDSLSKPPALIPKLKEKAYLSAKALVHLAVQRKGIKSEEEAFKSISLKLSTIGSWNCGGDSDLESTLGMIDRVFKDDGSHPMRWEQFSFTAPHHIWMGYTLRCHTWRTLTNNQLFPCVAKEFVLHTFQRKTSPPAPVTIECLHIISLLLGITLQNDDQQVDDERIGSQIDGIYKELERVWNTHPPSDKIDRAVEAMKLIAPLSRADVATKGCRLFQTIIHTPVSPTHSEEKFEASRLALHSTCEGGEPLLLVNDPQGTLNFLNPGLELTIQGKDQDAPIHNALRALAYASNPATINTPGHLDLASFVHGIRFAFEAGRPHKLREAALLALPLISDEWFDAARRIIPNKMGDFCQDWATVVDSIEHTSDAKKAILTTLFHMMDSPHWRPHIPEGKWKLLEYYSLVPDDCRPLKRCLENQELLTAISQVTDPEAFALWPRILWSKYDELTPKIQEALKEVTKAAPRSHIDECYPKVGESLEEAELERLKYPTWSNDPAAAALDRKIRSIREANDALKAIKRRR